MFFYKLKKVFKEKSLDIIKASSVLSLVASFIPLAPFLFLHVDDMSFKEKRQMVIISILCFITNLFMIQLTDYVFEYSIISSIFIGLFFSFLLFFTPSFLIMTYFEFSEIRLDKSEIRDAKVDSLLRKLFW